MSRWRQCDIGIESEFVAGDPLEFAGYFGVKFDRRRIETIVHERVVHQIFGERHREIGGLWHFVGRCKEFNLDGFTTLP